MRAMPFVQNRKNWIASFRRGKFSIEDEDHLVRLLSIHINTNIVYDGILPDRQKQIFEVLDISYERVHVNFVERKFLQS